ncbi:AAA family ATPase [Nocardia salmonicida]|uniref:phosphatase domain-containing protein n=1 Tax=Nocardia salmonicida TaxID=53431 RepID=UPI0033E34376
MTITRGYPGSGKTTWALAQTKNPNTVKAPSRDDLRAALYGVEVGNAEQETNVTAVQFAAVRRLLADGREVIVDNTHLRYRDAQRWADLAEDLGVRFACFDFYTTVSVCKANNRRRGESGGRMVPPEVIDSMAKRYPRESWMPVEPRHRLDIQPVEFDPALPVAFIWDVDGTLALNESGRSPFDMSRVLADSPNPFVLRVQRMLREYAGGSLERPKHFVFTGRTDDARLNTEQWLSGFTAGYDALHMRRLGDQRKDSVVKLEMFNEHIRGRYNVVGVFDDRNQVVSMWRRLGLTCFQVAEGDF